MARPKGTTRAKKPILKKEFEYLLYALCRSNSLLEATKVKLEIAFTLLYLTGCRVSEIIEFHTYTLKQIVRDNEYSLTNTTKTKRSRLICFDSQGKQTHILRRLIPPDDKYLFAKNNSDKPMSVDSLKLMMNKFIQKTLGALYSTHSFRAGYITIAHQTGLSLEHIRQDIGHKDIATTARYATVSNEEIATAKNMRIW